ncbi:hypothetical protein OROMI_022722 [Orobanche minor]
MLHAMHGNDQENSESPSVGLVLDGPYAHIFLANFQRQLQQSVNAGKKIYKNRKGMSHRLAENEIEPPKHEPPPKPLPADNLKPSIKSIARKSVGKAKKLWKVTWAADVYDPAPSADSHHLLGTSEWSKSENKNKKGGKINPQTPPSNALTDVSNNAGSSSNCENNLKSGKKGHKGGNIVSVEGGGARANKGGKHKDKKLVEVIETPIVAAGEGSSRGAKGKDKQWERLKGGKKK